MEFLRMVANLNGKEVFITIPIKEIDIVTRDNEKSFDVIDNFPKLEDIIFESMYD